MNTSTPDVPRVVELPAHVCGTAPGHDVDGAAAIGDIVADVPADATGVTGR